MNLDAARAETAVMRGAELRPAEPAASPSGLTVRGVDLTRVKPTTWLWEKRLPIGYLALLLGAEGMGKGTFTAWLAAQVTRGDLAGEHRGKPAPVLIVGDEDSFDSVFVPRAVAAGADIDLLHLLDEEHEALDLRANSAAFTDLLRDGQYALVLLDSLLDTLGVDTDDWRAKQVRDALRPLRRAVNQLDSCALASLHPNKGQRGNFRDLVSGTFAFNASSRSSLLLTQHPDDESRRVLVRGKGNLSIAPPSFEFGVESAHPQINDYTFDVPAVCDVEEGDLTVEDLLQPAKPAPIRESLAEKIHALGTGGIQTRAEIAQAIGRTSDDRSVGRALDQLEADGRWIKEGRGKWRRLGIGIGTSREAPMSKSPTEDDLLAEGERLAQKFGEEF